MALGLLAAVIVAMAVAWGAARVGMASTGEIDRSVTVMVGEGDTVWSIAGDVAPAADRRRLVDRIISVNDLGSARVEPGQRLVVPTRP